MASMVKYSPRLYRKMEEPAGHKDIPASAADVIVGIIEIPNHIRNDDECKFMDLQEEMMKYSTLKQTVVDEKKQMFRLSRIRLMLERVTLSVWYRVSKKGRKPNCGSLFKLRRMWGKMKERIYFFLIAFLIASVWNGIPATSVAAEGTALQNEPADLSLACNPVDFIFLVDQTSKMQKVDPEDLRLKVIQWTIMLLGYDHMYHCPDASYRVSVISYGGQISSNSNVITDIPMIEISPRLGQGLDAWRGDWKRLVARLVEPEGSRTRNLMGGLEMVSEMLGPSTEGRKQALIIFNADWGSPCVAADDCKPVDAQAMIRDTKSVLPSLGDGRSLWFYAFPDNDAALPFEEYAGETWKEVLEEVNPASTNFIKVKDNSPAEGLVLARQISDIFSSFNSRTNILRESVCSLEVPPFLKQMGFLIYKSDASTTVAIDDPDPNTPAIVKDSTIVGQMKISDSPKNIPAGNVEPFVIDRPMPGDWRIRECESSMFVLYFQHLADQLITVNPKTNILPQYSNPNLPEQQFDPERPNYLQIQIVDDNQVAIAQYEGFPSVISGEISMPNGSLLPLDFTYDQEATLYKSTEPLPVQREATYAWTVVFQREAQSEALTLKGNYAVKKVAPIKLVLELPFKHGITLHGDYFRHRLKILPISVSAKFVSATNEELFIPWRQLDFPDPEQTIKVTLTHIESGTKQTIWLRPSLNEKNNDYVFEGTIGDELDLEGDYQIEASLSDTGLKGMNPLFRLFADASKAKAEFEREDNAFTVWWTYFFALTVLCGVVLWLLARGYRAFSNPVDGNLEFYRQGGPANAHPLATIPLAYMHKRNRVVKREEITRVSRLLKPITQITARRIGGPEDESAIEVQLHIDHPAARSKVQKTPLYQGANNAGQASTSTNRPTRYDLPGGMYLRYRARETDSVNEEPGESNNS